MSAATKIRRASASPRSAATGAGLLAPGSDIDLLFLLVDPNDAAAKKVVETILYVLWDLKQKVGHSTRTIEECLAQARADMTIRTAMLEARLLAGDEASFERMRGRFEKEIVAKTASEFVSAKLSEREKRVKRAGESRYLVEPNVKEGKGRPARSQHAVLDREIRLPGP